MVGTLIRPLPCCSDIEFEIILSGVYLRDRKVYKIDSWLEHWLGFVGVQHYVTLFAQKFSLSLYSITSAMSYGVVNYFPRLQGTVNCYAICIFSNWLFYCILHHFQLCTGHLMMDRSFGQRKPVHTVGQGSVP